MATEKVLTLGSAGIVEKEITVAADDLAIKQSISLTAGQTSIAIPGGYLIAGVIVFLNGAYLSPAEYTATDGLNVVLAIGAPSTGSVLDVISLFNSGLLVLGTAALRTALGTTGSLYSRDSILGTVSQVSGVPTGAIIERGSNSNGEYIKYADGTMECRVGLVVNIATTSAYEGGFRSVELAWTFPVAFASGSDPICVGVTGFNTFGLIHSVVSNTQFRYIFLNLNSQAAVDRVARLTAHGRWY